MHLINRCSLVVLLLAATACGPESKDKDDSDWVLGVFSNRDVRDHSLGLSSVGHYEFREDGVLHGTVLTQCAQNEEEPAFEYEWRHEGDGDGVVVIELPEDDPFEEWRITPGSDCSSVHVDQIQDGEARVSYGLTRGAVCMKELPPCVST